MKELHHFQPNAYYSAILDLLEHAHNKKSYKDRLLALRPGQSLTYYKEVVSRAQQDIPMMGDGDERDATAEGSRSRPTHSAEADHELEDELELRGTSELRLAIGKQKGKGKGRTTGRAPGGRTGRSSDEKKKQRQQKQQRLQTKHSGTGKSVSLKSSQRAC